MKRIITLTALVLSLTGGIAAADRGRGDRVRDHRVRDRVIVRDRAWNNNRYDRRTDRTRYDRNRTVRVTRTRPVFRDNRFYFNGGYYRQYHRPVINVRYRDYYRRPALIVENYDPVPGYVWVQGNWSWNGYEWIWMPGHYEVDANYDGYGDGYYNSGAGVTIGGSIRF